MTTTNTNATATIRFNAGNGASSSKVRRFKVLDQKRAAVREALMSEKGYRASNCDGDWWNLDVGDRVSLKVGKRAIFCRVIRIDEDNCPCGSCSQTYTPVLGKRQLLDGTTKS